MIYKLIDTNNITRFYDQQLNKFYDNFMSPISLYEIGDTIKYFDPTPDYYGRLYKYRCFNPHGKIYVEPHKIFKVKIQLGLKCNYKCKYCCQNNDCKTFSPLEKIDLNKFYTLIKNSFIDWSKIQTLEFWGGEPLVYWKYLKPIIEFFRDEIKYSGKIYITTNGSLFNQEKYDFFLKNRVQFMFSHDGLGQKYWRNQKDWIDNEEIRSLISNYIKIGQLPSGGSYTGTINFVPSPQNKNFFNNIDYFNEKLYDGVPIGIEAALRCHKDNYDVWNKNFTQKDLDDLENNLYSLATLPQDSKYYKNVVKIRQSLLKTINNLATERLLASYNAKCPCLGRNVLTFHVNGDLIVCHNTFPHYKCSGNISNIKECFYENLISLHGRENCSKCYLVSSCGGSCPLLDDFESELECKSVIWFDRAYFRAAHYVFFGTDIKEITDETGKTYYSK